MTSAITRPFSKPQNPPLLWFGLAPFWMHSHMHILPILHVSINTLTGSSMNKIIPGATLSRNPVSHRRDKRPKPAQSNVFSRTRRLSPHPGTLIKWVPRLPTAYKYGAAVQAIYSRMTRNLYVNTLYHAIVFQQTRCNCVIYC